MRRRLKAASVGCACAHTMLSALKVGSNRATSCRKSCWSVRVNSLKRTRTRPHKRPARFTPARTCAPRPTAAATTTSCSNSKAVRSSTSSVGSVCRSLNRPSRSKATKRRRLGLRRKVQRSAKPRAKHQRCPKRLTNSGTRCGSILRSRPRRPVGFMVGRLS